MTPELEALLKKARDWYANASQEEIDAMIAKQKASWVRAEMNWPKPKYHWENDVKVYDSYEDYCND